MVILIVTTVVIDCGNLAWELRPFAFKNSLIISLIHLDEFGKFNIPTKNAFTSTEPHNKHLVIGFTSPSFMKTKYLQQSSYLLVSDLLSIRHTPELKGLSRK